MSFNIRRQADLFNGVSADEVRRQLRSLGRDQTTTNQAMRRVLRGALAQSADRDRGAIDRRQLLRLGGLTVAGSAVIAACGGDANTIGRVGSVESEEGLPNAGVNDIVLLRTATSLEYSALRVYEQAGGLGVITGTALEYVKRFVDDHEGHKALFQSLTEEAGGVAWETTNCKLDSILIDPAIERIVKGAPATDTSEAIGPSSDDENDPGRLLRDLLHVAHALESMAGSAYQMLVGMFEDAALRRDALLVGATEARHSALLALTINADRPSGWVPSDVVVDAEAEATEAPDTTVQDIAANTTPATEGEGDEPTGTVDPPVTAVPSQFGSLAAVQIVVGLPDANGSRLKANVETPSLNSLIYEYLDACE
jgi:hypothetical protein